MEYWDLYTKDRIRTEKRIKKGESVPKGYFRTVVHVAIFNSKGEMLIQQRQDDKKLWANLWDVTVAGSVMAGETSVEAAQRETLEEIGYRFGFQERKTCIYH